MLQAKFPIDWSAPLKEKRWHAHPHYGTRVKHETEKKKKPYSNEVKKEKKNKNKISKERLPAGNRKSAGTQSEVSECFKALFFEVFAGRRLQCGRILPSDRRENEKRCCSCKIITQTILWFSCISALPGHIYISFIWTVRNIASKGQEKHGSPWLQRTSAGNKGDQSALTGSR